MNLKCSLKLLMLQTLEELLSLSSMHSVQSNKALWKKV